jgi:glucosylceramidase
MAFLAVMVLIFQSCRNNDNHGPDQPDPNETGKARVWLTAGDKTRLLSRQEDLSITENTSTTWPVITVDTATAFQAIEGFGAALTGSSAYVLNKSMNATDRLALLNELFDPATGIGISYLRLTMGASDFSLSDYTYDDLPAGHTDFGLEQFSLSRDLEDVVPVLKEIVQINPEIKLMGTPWSPPAWMKTNGSLRGGRLKAECYSVLADYFVRYVQAMKDEGITITAVTPQNEPLYFTAGYPCMEMQPAEQATFIKDHLGPKLQQAGLNTRTIIYDHNWDHFDYPITVLNDPEAKGYIAGSAFHAYSGDVSAMSTVHYAHPDKALYFTEISGGGWATSFPDNLMWYMRNVFIGATLNWSSTAMMWNLALNHDWGPQNNGCADCRGVVTYNTVTYQVTRNEEYYSVGHFSKFVRPGAVRIPASPAQALGNFGTVAFQNADGSKVLVTCNYDAVAKSFTVKQDKKTFSFTLPPVSVATIIW